MLYGSGYSQTNKMFPGKTSCCSGIFSSCKRLSGGTSSCVTLIFQHHMFIMMEYRHLLNVSVQNTIDYISENFKNFSRGAWTRNSLEKCAVRSSDGCQRAHIATAYIFRPPLSQNLPSAPDKDGHSPAKKRISAPFLKFIHLCSVQTL